MKKHKNKLGQEIGFPVKNWQQRARPPRTSIQGQYCRIELFDADAHSRGLFAAFAQDSDHRNWTYLPYGPFAQLQDFRRWANTACTKEDPLFHTVIDNDTNRAVGMASYLRINPPVGVIEVGHIHFSPKLQRTPMATEAMYLMMRRVFDQLGYRRYEWKCDALNQPSNRAARRLGFSFEGIFRQATMYKNRNRDTAWYAILDHEWPAIKAAFAAWLDPDNFEDSGIQRNSLVMPSNNS